MSKGFVYFLQVGTDGPIKVGFTKSDVRYRLRAIQKSSPHVLRWIGFFTGTRGDEKDAHRLLQDSSLRGEWFHPTPEVLAFVEQKSAGFTPISYSNELFSPHRVAGRSEWWKRVEHFGENS